MKKNNENIVYYSYIIYNIIYNIIIIIIIIIIINLTWDVSIVNTVAASYIQTTSVTAGGATEIASAQDCEVCGALEYILLLSNIFETFGPINDLGLSFLDELGRRIADCTGHARETTHLLQRISVTIQRFNSILFRGSLAFAAASCERPRS